MSGRIRLFWLILAVLFAASAGFACFYAGLFGTIYNRPDGDPGETVTQFFDSVRNGNFISAYSCLSDTLTLGLEKQPETAEAQQLYAALRESYRYSLLGDSQIQGREASQRVNFRALNLRKAETAAAELVDGILEQKVAELPDHEVYDGNGGYLTSLTDSVYAEALRQALQDPEPLCTETNLDIQLTYANGGWKMITDRTLMSALIGGEG